MRKICYIISDIDKSVFFEHTAIILREADFEISFILINGDEGKLKSFLIQNNFAVFCLELKSLYKCIKVIRKCYLYLIQLKPDIVHCHLSVANIVGLPAAYFAKIKTRIFTQHTGKSLKGNWKEKILDQANIFFSTKIVAITESIKKMLVDKGFSEKKIKMIHSGFDLNRIIFNDQQEVKRIKEQYNPGNKNPVIGVIARWVEYKGIQYIIRAFEKLLAYYPDALLCLFNATQQTSYSKQIMKLLSEIPEINYKIVAFEYNVYDLYQLFDVFVHVPVDPRCEAFGQVYVESLAAGVPSIFTLSGVASEFIIPDVNAVVCRFKNEEDIFLGLKKTLSDCKYSAALVENGRKKVLELFSLDIYRNKLIELYK